MASALLSGCSGGRLPLPDPAAVEQLAAQATAVTLTYDASTGAKECALSVEQRSRLLAWTTSTASRLRRYRACACAPFAELRIQSSATPEATLLLYFGHASLGGAHWAFDAAESATLRELLGEITKTPVDALPKW